MTRKQFDQFRFKAAQKFRKPTGEDKPVTAHSKEVAEASANVESNQSLSTTDARLEQHAEPLLIAEVLSEKTSFSETRVAPEANIDLSEPFPSRPDQIAPDKKNLQTTAPKGKPRQFRFKGWPLLWLSLLFASGSTCLGAFLLLTTVPPPPDCQQKTALVEDGERLYCAQQAAASGELDKLLAAIKLVEKWSSDHPRYSEAQHLIEEWSTSILLIARQKAASDDLEGAIKVAKQIPARSPVYQEAQATIVTWQTNWNEGQVIYDKAQLALKTQDWRLASEQAQLLSRSTNEYWRARVKGLKQQIITEKKAQEHLQAAQDLAQSGTPELLGEAIKLVQKVNPKSYVRATAQSEITRWSEMLLQIAAEQMEQQDLEGAIFSAQQVPAKSALGSQAQDLVQLCQAQQLASSEPSVTEPIHGQLWSLWAALLVARQITPKDPLYRQVQTYIPEWEKQIQDLTQLQLANTIASLGQITTFQLAIAQAEQVKLNRPQRLHAQTLIAHWRKEIQRIEDRPYLLQAQALAKSGTLTQLKAAIAQAKQIQPGRALRPEAQAAIAEWNRQIQVFEDQPILDKARALAKQTKYDQAIQVAEQIGSERPLYNDAQAAINNWVTQLEITADRTLLDEARLMAASKDYVAAINIASQITSARALYSEAQDAIARWNAELELLQPVQPPEVEVPAASPEVAPSPTSESAPASPLGEPPPPQIGESPAGQNSVAPPSPLPTTP